MQLQPQQPVDQNHYETITTKIVSTLSNLEFCHVHSQLSPNYELSFLTSFRPFVLIQMFRPFFMNYSLLIELTSYVKPKSHVRMVTTAKSRHFLNAFLRVVMVRRTTLNLIVFCLGTVPLLIVALSNFAIRSYLRIQGEGKFQLGIYHESAKMMKLFRTDYAQNTVLHISATSRTDASCRLFSFFSPVLSDVIFHKFLKNDREKVKKFSRVKYVSKIKHLLEVFFC